MHDADWTKIDGAWEGMVKIIDDEIKKDCEHHKVNDDD